ncbi:MAG: hypothetical protein GY822_14695 [Deltaproteobacteria bacterium]|nr:hypothetical protein [Deltaproteobacteria bacterium]
MTTRLAFRAGLICSASFAVALFAGCGPTTTTDDAGTPDVSPDAGPDTNDAGPDEGRQLGQTCVVATDECAADLVCYPNPLSPTAGTCRIVCGELNDAQDGVDEMSPSPCIGSDVCQAVLNLQATGAADQLLGVVCLPQAAVRDGACVPTANDASCAESIGENVECARAGDGFACRVACGADGSCPGTESCLGTGGLTSEVDAAGANINCTDDTACTAPFTCTDAFFNDGTPVKICADEITTCGVSIPPVTNADLDAITATSSLPEELTCLTEGSRICEDFFETPDHGLTQCVDLTGGDGAGVCFAICGLLNDDETGYELFEGCPATFECTTEQGMDFGLGFGKEDAAGADVTCDLANCTDDAPCPDECDGDASAYCLNGQNGGTCFFPAFTCEPEGGAPDTDAGTPDTDAGTPAGDAGPPARDAGPPAGDAGPPARDGGPPAGDAGPPARDGGPPARDAGPPARDAGTEP